MLLGSDVAENMFVKPPWRQTPCYMPFKAVFFGYKCLRCQPPNGFTVAQFGPPSLPVPGTLACSIELPDNESMSFQVIPVKGILSRLDQIVSNWPAQVPTSI